MDPLISHAAPLEQAPELFAELLETRQWSNKVLFAVGAEARAEAQHRSGAADLAGAR